MLRLTPKAFQLLTLLVEKRPSAVSKEEIEDALWPEKLVTEGNVTTLVKEIRHVLGDDARAPGLVRTVYGYGYAVTPEITSTAPPAAGPITKPTPNAAPINPNAAGRRSGGVTSAI